MAAFLNMHAINGKPANRTPINAASHNLRTIAAETQGHPGDRINPTQSHKNRILSGPSHPAEVLELMERLIHGAGAKVLRKNQIKMFEVVVNPKQAIPDLDVFFEDTMLWLVDHFGCNLLSAVVHHDESEPHMHLLFLPLRDGKLQGHSIMGSPAETRKMQADFHHGIGKRHGLTSARHYSKSERESGAKTGIESVVHAIKNETLTADQTLILKQAIAGPSFEKVMQAFNIDLDKSQNAIAVGSEAQKPDRYYYVEVDCPPVLHEPTKTIESQLHAQEELQQPKHQNNVHQYIRERDDDHSAEEWDTELGEYRAIPNNTASKVRDTARA